MINQEKASLLTYEEEKKINDVLTKLTPDKQRSTVDKAIRLIKQDIIEKNKDEKNRYLPKLKKFDVVHCNFTGVGYEWDFPHYAMVWDVDPILDSIEVIPMTSVSREEHADVFSIGKVFGLPNKNSTLLLSDRTRVSRKRIEKLTVTHPKHGEKSVTIPRSWEDKIINGILSKNMKCSTFQSIISEDCGVAMIDSLKDYNTLKFKAIIERLYNSENRILQFRLWNSINSQQLNLILPKKKTSKDMKKKQIKNLNSNFPDKVKEAKLYFEEVYGINS